MNNKKTTLNLPILVAEDNEINQKVISAILSRNGFHFEIVNNGLEAYEKIKNNPFCLILMDCQMPVLDGLEATLKIRDYEQQQRKKSCPIIALTANAMLGDKEKCLGSGMNDFLSKPFKKEDLIEKIITWTSIENQNA